VATLADVIQMATLVGVLATVVATDALALRDVAHATGVPAPHRRRLPFSRARAEYFDPLPEPRNAETLGADYPTNTSPVMNGWIMQTNVYGLPDASAKRNT
jgi:hypothetical protein